MNIVIVDNDTAFLRSVELMLRAVGHRVHTFFDPETACGYIERGGRPDILLLDYLMPRLSGVELLERIRKFLSHDTRVILISGHTDLIQSLDLGAIGVTAFLPKPLDLQKLDEMLIQCRGPVI
jgi:DNA-binding NtrC family response regulator